MGPWFNGEKTSVPEGKRKEQRKSMNCFALESGGGVGSNHRNAWRETRASVTEKRQTILRPKRETKSIYPFGVTVSG